MSKGIVMLAQNNPEYNYVLQACVCAMSIALTNPGTNVSLITNNTVPEKYKKFFDKIIPIPWQDDAADSEWKIENRWKIFHVTPYDETVVMDTDMLVLQDISTWWKYLEDYDMFFTSKVFTYRHEEVTSNYYRKTFVANELPNVYVGFYYFKKSDLALEFFEWLELVVNNWELFYGKYTPIEYPNRCSMDVSAAIVLKIMDIAPQVINTKTSYPSFTHMKPAIQGWYESPLKWQNRVDVYINQDCEIKIGNHLQTGILHYTEKDFLDDVVISRYEEKLNVS
jgi:hypothetical protein